MGARVVFLASEFRKACVTENSHFFNLFDVLFEMLFEILVRFLSTHVVFLVQSSYLSSIATAAQNQPDVSFDTKAYQQRF